MPGFNRNPRGAGYGEQAVTPPPSGLSGFPFPGYPPPINPRNVPNMRPVIRGGGYLPVGGPARAQAPGPVGMGWGVSAMAPSGRPLVNIPGQRANFVKQSTAANIQNPLFGRPGFAYQQTRPAPRLGPIAKLSPGTGLTGKGANRSQGHSPAGSATEQYIPVTQFDYQPKTQTSKTLNIPKTIGVGNDGIEVVGTYRAHDSTPASHFFVQNRSSAFWMDQTFGPDYRLIPAPQLVARYNLYNQIALAAPLSPQNYFLGYQVQMPQMAQIGATGMSRPLGY